MVRIWGKTKLDKKGKLINLKGSREGFLHYFAVPHIYIRQNRPVVLHLGCGLKSQGSVFF